jgi:hypothetical protein
VYWLKSVYVLTLIIEDYVHRLHISSNSCTVIIQWQLWLRVICTSLPLLLMNRLIQSELAVFWYMSCSVAFKIYFPYYLTITFAMFVSCGGRKTSPRTFNHCCNKLRPLKAFEHDNYFLKILSCAQPGARRHGQ